MLTGVASATRELTTVVQASLTRRGALIAPADPALKRRAKLRRRYAAGWSAGFSFLMRRISIIILLMMLAAFCQQVAAQQKEAGVAAPSEVGFRLKGLDGKFYDTSEMRGQVLVVSFGATWCVPCAWEAVAIEELKEEYKGKPVRFLAVNIEDPKRMPNEVLRYYAKERRTTVTVLRDPGGEALARFTQGARIPVLVFFDREGHFDAPAHHGMQQDMILYKQMVRQRVNALLGRQAGKPEAGAAAR
jgi:thiol-disulfide isomerase/thioredoxin